MMILVVLLLFVFFGFATAFFELGAARMTQAGMQVAADGSALDGLRFRDHPLVFDRAAAREVVEQVFDDDFGTGSANHTLGAGPAFELSGGVGATANALQTIESAGVYTPHLQLHLPNETHGDLVKGRFLEEALLHREDSQYERTDFLPTPSGDERPSASCLSRLRRTNDFSGLDNLEGVSSSGPALPFLFGRAMAMSGDGSYEPRHHGLTIRAAAIADARRVTLAGLAVPEQDPGGPILGVLNLALERGDPDGGPGWDSLPVGESTIRARDDEVILLVGEEERKIGRFVRDLRSPVELGSLVPEAFSTVLVRPWVGYVPIFETILGRDRVIGFGMIEIREIGVKTATLVKRTGVLAYENSTAAAPGSLVNNVFLTLSAPERDEVLAAHARFFDPLLAPVLVR
ncbi:MAG: hypothetical protein V2A76_06755 [Planctomycetota bacterium]